MFAFAPVLSATEYRAGDWRIDVAVTPDQPAIMLGEPTSLSFTVKNLTDENLQILVGGDYRNDLGRPDSFQVKTVRKDGKWVSQPDAGYSLGGLLGPRDLPARGAYVFRLFVPHWATFTEAGTYEISCRRTVQLLRPSGDESFAKQPTSDVVVDAKATLQVTPRDEARMGRLIAGLGEQMLSAGGRPEGDDAVLKLAWIDDPRVVAYFRRALKIETYAFRFIAVQTLGKFATDEAFEGLQAAMAMKASDFEYAPAGGREQLAVNIRVAAAGALSKCRHRRHAAFFSRSATMNPRTCA